MDVSSTLAQTKDSARKVNRAVSDKRQSVPVCPDEPTTSEPVGMVEKYPIPDIDSRFNHAA
jgi:hypothetical protein